MVLSLSPNFWDALTPVPSRDSDKQHKDPVPNIYRFSAVSYSLILSVSNVSVIFVVGVVYTGTIRENKFFFY